MLPLRFISCERYGMAVGKLQGILLCIAIARMLSACSNYEPAATCNKDHANNGTWKNPVYPNASDLVAGNSSTDDTTFDTADSSDEVLKYYDDIMLKAGWEPSLGYISRETPSPNISRRSYSISNCCYYGASVLEIETVPNGLTHVTISNGWSIGCG